jgi:hypothetical protein
MIDVKLLYRCDAWHSCASMDLLGAFTNKKALKRFLSGMKRDGLLDREDLEEMQIHRQTQGKELNYTIEDYSPNPKYSKTKSRLKPRKNEI